MVHPPFNIDDAHQLGDRDLAEIDAWLSGESERCVVVKRNSKRTVYAISPEPGGTPTVFLKHDHPQGPRDRSKQIIRPKVQYEYKHTNALLEQGLPVITPLFAAWNLVEGIFVSAALADVRDADVVWKEIGDDEPRKRRYLDGLRALLDAVIGANVWHLDFHLGNLLCRESDARAEFFLVDCFGVQSGSSLSKHKRNVMLLILFQLGNGLSESQLCDFLKSLACVGADEDAAVLLDALRDLGCDAFYKKWPKRKRKLMRSSGFAAHHSESDGEWRVNRSSELDLARRIVDEHARLRDAGGDGVLKASRKRCVSAPLVDGVTYIVKEFFNPGPWGTRSADARCWLNTWGLTFLGLPVPPVIAWHRDVDGHGFVVSEFVSGKSAFDAMNTCLDDDDAFERLAGGIYGIVRKLYRCRILHGDLKLNNVLVQADSLWLIDNDSVQFNVKITQKHWEKNLKHLVRSGEHPVFEKLIDCFSRQPPPYE